MYNVHVWENATDSYFWIVFTTDPNISKTKDGIKNPFCRTVGESFLPHFEKKVLLYL